MAYPKHEGNGKRPRKKAATEATQTVTESDQVGLLQIAKELGEIHNSLRSYNSNACNGEMSFKVQLGEDDCTVRIECEALDRVATAFERIADALAERQDGAGQKS